MTNNTKPLVLIPEAAFAAATEAVRRGRIVAYPTETFYGLGVDPFNPEALELLYALKGRGGSHPVPVLVSGAGMLEGLVADIPEVAERLMERFWPGPLTIIFRARPTVPDLLTGGTGTIGVRVSSSPVCAKLLDAIGSPITTTSANPSGRPPAATAGAVTEYFGPAIDVLIDGGPLDAHSPTTVVDVTGTDGPAATIVREGLVSWAEIEAALI